MLTPAPLFRALYQHVRATASLPGLQPRPLAAGDLLAGSSEFVITRGEDLPGGGWVSAGLLVPRAYLGYIAVHYASGTDQHETYTDEAAIVRALLTFDRLPAVAANPAFRGLGDTPSDWFLNTTPEQAGKPPVLTLAFEFSLQIDLTIQEGMAP